MNMIDKKYFGSYTLDDIKNYKGNVYQNHTPSAMSMGAALHGLNRQPFGGSPMYYQQSPQIQQQTPNLTQNQVQDVCNCFC